MASNLLVAEDIEYISNIGPFVELPLAVVAGLVGGATARDYPKHSLLFSHGDVADRFYIVLGGRVKLFTATEGGEENVIGIFSGGQSFGEAAMFASGRFPVNAEVVEDARLVQIMAEPLVKHLSDNKDLAFQMLAVMARRHRRFLSDISDFKIKSPGQRLGSFLLALTDVDKGPAKARLPFDKALIAARIGIKPESFSRALARLREIGVNCHGRNVDFEDVRKLRAFCEEGGLHLQQKL